MTYYPWQRPVATAPSNMSVAELDELQRQINQRRSHIQPQTTTNRSGRPPADGLPTATLVAFDGITKQHVENWDLEPGKIDRLRWFAKTRLNQVTDYLMTDDAGFAEETMLELLEAKMPKLFREFVETRSRGRSRGRSRSSFRTSRGRSMFGSRRTQSASATTRGGWSSPSRAPSRRMRSLSRRRGTEEDSDSGYSSMENEDGDPITDDCGNEIPIRTGWVTLPDRDNVAFKVPFVDTWEDAEDLLDQTDETVVMFGTPDTGLSVYADEDNALSDYLVSRPPSYVLDEWDAMWEEFGNDDEDTMHAIGTFDDGYMERGRRFISDMSSRISDAFSRRSTRGWR